MRERIPETLWNSAVKMAGTYGSHRTAKVLRVNYYGLKKRVEQEVAVTPGVPEVDAVAAFVELTSPLGTGCCEFTLELEGADGAKMRAHLKGGTTPDLAALSRSFWQVES